MDRGGRLAGSLTPPLLAGARPVHQGDGRAGLIVRSGPRFAEGARAPAETAAPARRRAEPRRRPARPGLARIMRALGQRGVGFAALAFFLSATTTYGVILGGHQDAARTVALALPDAVASVAGFRINSILVDGRADLRDDDLLAAIDGAGQGSLVFLNARAVRDRLLRNPIVEDATVRKLFPDRLSITVRERAPFVIWQTHGSLVVAAADGTVLDTVSDGRFSRLPLVVGNGAAEAAKDFIGILSGYPEIMDHVYASVRVGGRRWNLRLKTGTDVMLPEEGVDLALARLAALHRQSDIFSRDLATIDMRSGGRTVVRLSPAAAEAEAEAAALARTRTGRGAT